MVDTLTDAPAPFTGTEVHTLSNGLRVILKEDHTVPVVSIQVWAKCGAVNETTNIYGISHALEHMVFKGTPTRSAGEITEAIESQGGYINAATQLETTHYYIDVPSYGTKQALEVLADTVLHPSFPNQELDRERLVILEEIRSRDDNPDALLWDEFIAHVFQNTPYSVRVIGNEKTVSSMTQEDLFQYFRAFYVPDNKCVAVVGDFEKNEMLNKLKSLFEGERPGIVPAQLEIEVNGGAVDRKTINKNVPLCHIAMGLPTIGLSHSDVVGMDVLADVLGGGASSRYYQKYREDLRLVLSLTCDYTAFIKKGLFSVFIETLPEKRDDAINKIIDDIKNLNNHPIKPEELSRAKARIKSEWLHSTETPRGQASTLGSLGVMGHIDLIKTYLQRIDKLTPNDLMKIYDSHIVNKKIYITEILPVQ